MVIKVEGFSFDTHKDFMGLLSLLITGCDPEDLRMAIRFIDLYKKEIKIFESDKFSSHVIHKLESIKTILENMISIKGEIGNLIIDIVMER